MIPVITIPEGAILVVEPGDITAGAAVLGYAEGPEAWKVTGVAREVIDTTGQQPEGLDGYTALRDPDVYLLAHDRGEHGIQREPSCGRCW